MTAHPHAAPSAKKYNTVEQVYQRILAAYAEKYPTNDKLQKAVKGKTRRILVHVPDGPSAAFLLHSEKLDRIDPAEVGKPDIRIEAKEADLLAVFNKELSAVNAYMSRRVKIDASFGDLLLAKSFFG